jgi:hypothetical protein
MQLRRLARQLEASPPSPERDELLGLTRRRVVEIETEDLDPPSSLPALGDIRANARRAAYWAGDVAGERRQDRSVH